MVPSSPDSRTFAVPPAPANLIVGVIASGRETIAAARSVMEARYGAVDEESDVIPFDFTDYYRSEMGENLLRAWLSFAQLQPLDRLAEIKLATNALENQFLDKDGKRRVNLDPGFLTKHNLVLATTKDYSHRLYLGQGIFAEVTLVYEHGKFQSLRWTYPDYQSPAALDFLRRVRERYVKKLT